MLEEGIAIIILQLIIIVDGSLDLEVVLFEIFGLSELLGVSLLVYV